MDDRRLRSRREDDKTDADADTDRAHARRRRIVEPVVLQDAAASSDDDDDDEEQQEESGAAATAAADDDEMDDEERARRRMLLKQKALLRQQVYMSIYLPKSTQVDFVYYIMYIVIWCRERAHFNNSKQANELMTSKTFMYRWWTDFSSQTLKSKN